MLTPMIFRILISRNHGDESSLGIYGVHVYANSNSSYYLIRNENDNFTFRVSYVCC